MSEPAVLQHTLMPGRLAISPSSAARGQAADQGIVRQSVQGGLHRGRHPRQVRAWLPQDLRPRARPITARRSPNSTPFSAGRAQRWLRSIPQEADRKRLAREGDGKGCAARERNCNIYARTSQEVRAPEGKSK